MPGPAAKPCRACGAAEARRGDFCGRCLVRMRQADTNALVLTLRDCHEAERGRSPEVRAPAAARSGRAA